MFSSLLFVCLLNLGETLTCYDNCGLFVGDIIETQNDVVVRSERLNICTNKSVTSGCEICAIVNITNWIEGEDKEIVYNSGDIVQTQYIPNFISGITISCLLFYLPSLVALSINPSQKPGTSFVCSLLYILCTYFSISLFLSFDFKF